MPFLTAQLIDKYLKSMRSAILRTSIIVVLFSLLLVACESSTAPLPAPSETASSETINPTAIPTREGTPNLDGEEIFLYFLCGQSGPFADLNISRILAARDMVDHINSHGGIFGAQLNLQIVDTGGNAEVATSAYVRIMRLDENIPLLLLCDSNSEIALADFLLADSIPAIGPGIAERTHFEEDDSPLFAVNVASDQQFALWLDYLVDNWNQLKPSGAADEIRLAIVTDVGEYEADSPPLAYAAGLGVEIVDQIPITDSPNANLYDAVYSARDVNANAIYIHTRSPAAAELLNALNALGLRQRVVLSGSSFAFESSLLPYLFITSNATGTYHTLATAWWTDSDNRAINLAEEIFSTNAHPPEAKDAAYLLFLGAVDIAKHAIEEAIIAGRFENLDAQAIKASLSQLSNYSVLDGLFVVNYRSGNHFLDSLQIMLLADDPAFLTKLQDYSMPPQLEYASEE